MGAGKRPSPPLRPASAWRMAHNSVYLDRLELKTSHLIELLYANDFRMEILYPWSYATGWEPGGTGLFRSPSVPKILYPMYLTCLTPVKSCYIVCSPCGVSIKVPQEI
jgi:hypothetical protein